MKMGFSCARAGGANSILYPPRYYAIQRTFLCSRNYILNITCFLINSVVDLEFKKNLQRKKEILFANIEIVDLMREELSKYI